MSSLRERSMELAMISFAANHTRSHVQGKGYRRNGRGVLLMVLVLRKTTSRASSCVKTRQEYVWWPLLTGMTAPKRRSQSENMVTALGRKCAYATATAVPVPLHSNENDPINGETRLNYYCRL